MFCSFQRKASCLSPLLFIKPATYQSRVIRLFLWKKIKVKLLVAQSCLTLCNPMDCNPPGSSVHRILQAGILEWVAIHSLLQGIFLTQGSNSGLPHWRQIPYCMSNQENPTWQKYYITFHVTASLITSHTHTAYSTIQYHKNS